MKLCLRVDVDTLPGRGRGRAAPATKIGADIFPLDTEGGASAVSSPTATPTTSDAGIPAVFWVMAIGGAGLIVASKVG